MSEIRGVVSDFGGVLTSPLLETFAALTEDGAVPLEDLGMALAEIARRDGENPLFALEKGRLSEHDFLAMLGGALSGRLGREVVLHDFGERYFEALRPNPPMIAAMLELKERGLRMALLTNNVREWEPLWRAMLPVDDIFELIVDSAFVGMRKPDREIYDLTIERFGIPAENLLFIDDIDVNCATARELGMTAVHFVSNDQAIAEIEAALGPATPG